MQNTLRSSTAGEAQLAAAGWAPASEPGHAAQFYESEEHVVRAAGEYIRAGLACGEQVLLIAAPSRVAAFTLWLARQGYSAEQAVSNGQLAVADAQRLLSTFMLNDMPDRGLARAVIEDTLARLPALPGAPRLRIYGEMVDILARAGKTEAACEVEAMWGELCAERGLTLLCAYDLASFQHARESARFDEICRQHTHVFPSERYFALTDPAERLREVARLQQRERVHRAVEEELRLTVNREREARARAESSRAFKELFLGMLGHDLRNPLTAILNTSRLMSMQRGHDLETDKRVARLLSSSERMQCMIEQILDATRTRLTAGIGITLGEAADIVPLVTELVQEFRVAHPAYHFELQAPSPCLARIDAARFAQVLQNLLGNAVAHGDRQRPIRVSVDTDEGMVRVCVHNFGEQIAPDALALLFDPFARGGKPQGRSAGLGLGLYISQHVVRAHGGNITAESSETNGTLFEVRLPSP